MRGKFVSPAFFATRVTGFAITAFMAIFLNLILSEEIEDEAAIITANEADTADDREEWRQIRHGKVEEDGEPGEKSGNGKIV